jgi:hypothetical protein
MIRAGTIDEIRPNSGIWIILDIGFSQSQKSCGLKIGENKSKNFTFHEAENEIVEEIEKSTGTVNLVIEAPLSVAFNQNGNPTGRAFEKRDTKTRYWYTGPGCTTMVAAMYLIRKIVDLKPKAEIRLFEGFVSFSTPGSKSDHSKDVEALWEMIKNEGSGVIAIDEDSDENLQSAFKVMGIDIKGIPPVIKAKK